MPLATTVRNALLDLLFGNQAYTPPATHYIGLSTTTPNADGTNVTEPSGGGYARVAVTNNAINFPAASGGAKGNGTLIQFPQATAAWGTVTHLVDYDAATGGAFQGSGGLDTARTVNEGDQPEFAIDALTLQLS